MKWGWLARGAKVAAKVAGEREVSRLEAENRELRADRDYWRARCERLLDAALVKEGQPPIMAPEKPLDPLHGALSGLAMRSIPISHVPPQEGTR